MKKKLLYFFLFLSTFPLSAQDGFHLVANKDRVCIPFQLINNLVFIPVIVNGVELTFMLDSGVEETILFSLDDIKGVYLKNTEKVLLRGLGSEEAVEGLVSKGNVLQINGLESKEHLLYIILDQSFNLSSHIGIPVNGIIGYSFLKNNLVEIDYQKKKIYIGNRTSSAKKRLEKKYEKVGLTIERAKPYLMSPVVVDSKKVAAKLLVDIGNSDAIWLFDKTNENLKIPEKNFEDYLGKGFSGDVLGRRARIDGFSIASFNFKNPIVAFPDSSSIKHIKMVPGRVGSVGGEILKRFAVVFDYTNELMYLKRNNNYDMPFFYNKSGIEIIHSGVQWVQETVHLQTIPVYIDQIVNRDNKSASEFKYKFQLKPVYEIANVRKNSPAAIAGLKKGDIIVSINNTPGYKYSLYKINTFFKEEGEKWVNLEIERESQLLKFRFKLVDVL